MVRIDRFPTVNLTSLSTIQATLGSNRVAVMYVGSKLGAEGFRIRSNRRLISSQSFCASDEPSPLNISDISKN